MPTSPRDLTGGIGKYKRTTLLSNLRDDEGIVPYAICFYESTERRQSWTLFMLPGIATRIQILLWRLWPTPHCAAPWETGSISPPAWAGCPTRPSWCWTGSASRPPSASPACTPRSRTWTTIPRRCWMPTSPWPRPGRSSRPRPIFPPCRWPTRTAPFTVCSPRTTSPPTTWT